MYITESDSLNISLTVFLLLVNSDFSASFFFPNYYLTLTFPKKSYTILQKYSCLDLEAYLYHLDDSQPE